MENLEDGVWWIWAHAGWKGPQSALMLRWSSEAQGWIEISVAEGPRSFWTEVELGEQGWFPLWPANFYASRGL